jgi:proteasome lid subunit RPN8/RPN11
VKLNKEIIGKLYEHALKEYPDECCGIITGNDDVQTLHLCGIIQNRLHAKDPITYARNARTAYFIERREFDNIISAAKSKGERVMAFYHSHTEHEAYFSQEDVAAQTVFGEPEFPDALHIVVSIMNKKMNDIKCFKWDRQAEEFVLAEDCV